MPDSILRKNVKKLLVAIVLALCVTSIYADSSWRDRRDLEEFGDAFYKGDYVTSLRILRPIAERGEPSAQSTLGSMYARGIGTSKDYVEALKWYRLSAEQGTATALENLGAIYEKGLGVPPDYVEAHKWYGLAIERTTDGKNRKRLSKSRENVAVKLTPAEIAEAQKLAREWDAAHRR